jgi:hypothetical protein
MKTWCIKDNLTGHIFKVLFTKEEFEKYIEDNPDMEECINCTECDDAPSICIE